jgi:hypothetical protein
MKLSRNPFIGEGLSACFSHPLVLRTYGYYLAVAAAFTFFWWPRNPLAMYLRTGTGPQTFMVTAVGIFICLVYLNMRYGSEDYLPDGAMGVMDFVTRTPVSIAGIVAGKALSGAVHVLFLLLLGLPFLMVSRDVSGASQAAIPRFFLIAGCSSIAYRCFGFLVFAFMGAHGTLKQVVLVCGTIVLMTFSLTVCPPASALSAVLDLEGGGAGGAVRLPLIGGSIPACLVSVMISLIASAALLIASLARLGRIRTRFTPPPVPSARRDEE